MVIKKNFDLAIGSCCQKLPQAYTCEEIEAMALTKALSFALKLGFTKAMLEGVFLLIIKALRDDGGSLAPHGLLVEDVKFFSQCFVQLLYSHTKR